MKVIAAILGFLAVVSMRACNNAPDQDKNIYTALALALTIAATIASFLTEKTKDNKKP